MATMADGGAQIWAAADYPQRRSVWFWLRDLVWPADTVDHSLDVMLAAYADAMRAAALSAPVDGSSDGAAQQAFDAQIIAAVKEGRGGLAKLMAVESHLSALDSDALVARRYWTIRDRFARVASSQAIEAYNSGLPPELKQLPIAAERVRGLAQAREAARASVGLLADAQAALDTVQAQADAAPGDAAAGSAVAAARAVFADAAARTVVADTLRRALEPGLNPALLRARELETSAAAALAAAVAAQASDSTRDAAGAASPPYSATVTDAARAYVEAHRARVAVESRFLGDGGSAW